MKSITTVCLAIALVGSISAFGQSAQDYAALEEFLPAEKITQLQDAGEDRYAEFAFLNRHGYHLSPTGSKDITQYPDVSELSPRYGEQPPVTIAMVSSGQLNLMAYNFELHRDKYSYYRIPGSSKLLVIPPTELTIERQNQD